MKFPRYFPFRSSSRANPSPLRSLPRGIWALGFVSMFMDISSELIHSLLPVFMATVLGASMSTIGIIEGVAEATAAITKIFSGALSDYLKKRKLLALLGYGLATLVKPVFPMAQTIGWVFGARFLDRVGKGIRGAPRDALVANITPEELRGAAYGLRQSLDSVGAFIGPLAAVILMIWLADNIRAVLWVATIPAFLAVALLAFGVQDPAIIRAESKTSTPFSLADTKELPFRYWFVVLLGAIFTMARFSEAFLVLRAQDVGISIGYVPVVMIVMNVVYAASAYPVGAISDRRGHRALLIIGLITLIFADLFLAEATSPFPALVGAALWGLHMGFTQGLFAKLVADTSPRKLYGTAFGIFNLVTGVSLLLASVIAGEVWSSWGGRSTFLTGAAFAVLAMIGLLINHQKMD